MSELLLEILSEEIPARMQANGAADLLHHITTHLDQGGLSHTDAKTDVTPRRLIFTCRGLPDKTDDQIQEQRGPRTDAPQRAIQGFLKANDIALKQADRRTTPKGEFYFATKHISGRTAHDVLLECLPQALDAMVWPKSMRWCNTAGRWVRPVRGLLCVLDGTPLPLRWAGLVAGQDTFGHRFMAPASVRVNGWDDYVAKMQNAYVMVEAAARKHHISEAIMTVCSAAGLTPVRDEGLLNEVTGLVEWPVALLGRIDDGFMDLPPEVLSVSMRVHQKYFSCTPADSQHTDNSPLALAPAFVVIANREAPDGGAAMVRGNERVLRARLADAQFFWDLDRKTPLTHHHAGLRERIFHAKLGTLADKSARLETLARAIHGYLGASCAVADVEEAARLAKADLTTGMVGEFPQLQGIMGGYYARHQGLGDTVAEAIRTHHSPEGPHDGIPTAPAAICIALADKLDTLAGFFAIAETPTGSKDPFALRRAALGVIRIVLENGLRLPLMPVLNDASNGYDAEAIEGFKADTTGLLSFIHERLKGHLRNEGIPHDVMDALFAGTGHNDDIRQLLMRARALQKFLTTADGQNLLTAWRRASNILTIEEKKDALCYDEHVDVEAFCEPQEIALYTALQTFSHALPATLNEERYDKVMGDLAALRPVVDAFFEHVTVNSDTEKLRKNRLHLLSIIRNSTATIANFSKL